MKTAETAKFGRQLLFSESVAQPSTCNVQSRYFISGSLNQIHNLLQNQRSTTVSITSSLNEIEHIFLSLAGTSFLHIQRVIILNMNLLEERQLVYEARGSEDGSSTCTFKKINDSVYELYMPPPTRKADMDILFFHGLQLDETSAPHVSTWRSGLALETIWPKQWIPEEFPDARVLAISYDGSLKKSDQGGTMDSYLVAESLLQALLLADVGQARQVILVGHCVGGLIIKMICSLAWRPQGAAASTEQRLMFLESIRGIFYFGTPHQGSQFFDFVEKSNIKQGELVKFVRVLNKNLARLNQEFQDLRNRECFKWHIGGVGETLRTDLGGGLRVVIVEEASARCENFFSVNEDHFSICHPPEKHSTTYQNIVDFIRKAKLRGKEVDFEGDKQILPRTQVGPLVTLRLGEILRNLATDTALGLWGMGGIGKTTLAKAVFNQKRTDFEYTLFCENVKLLPGAGKDFEEKVLDEVHHRGKKMEMAPHISVLRGKDILIVLDDVEKDRDIEIVRKLQGTCSPKSRFLFTSRDHQILRNVDGIHIVEVEVLGKEWSERLLRSYAIQYDGPLLKWQQQCLENIVKHCWGLPLTLEVIGQYLKTSEKKKVWEQTLKVLMEADDVQAVGIEKVLYKLKASYDNLGDEEKQMFIDAATFFQGRVSLDTSAYYRQQWTLREAKAAWEKTHGSEDLRWNTLVDRSFVYDVAEDSAIEMHELFKNLGQKLADDQREHRRRICVDTNSFLEMVGRDFRGEVEKVRTIQFLNLGVRREVSEELLSTASLHTMENLQYLQLENYVLAREEVKLPKRLVIFQSKSIRENISFKACTKLAVLIISGFSRLVLPNIFPDITSLKVFSLVADFLESLPESFGNLRSLQKCRLMCQSLRRLPNSFSNLENLEHLKVRSKCLQMLPETFGKLGNLRHLEVESEFLQTLPETFGKLGNLRHLEVRRGRLERLPDTFGALQNLEHLVVTSECLQTLPETFGKLGNLRYLEVTSFWLERLPDTFGALQNLEHLYVKSDCLQTLPETFWKLGTLRHLEVRSDCLQTLPETFWKLGNLRHVYVRGVWLTKPNVFES